MACDTRDSSPLPNRSLPHRRRAVVRAYSHFIPATRLASGVSSGPRSLRKRERRLPMVGNGCKVGSV